MAICTHCRRDVTPQCPGLALSPALQVHRSCHPGAVHVPGGCPSPMAHGTLFLYPGGVMSPRPPWHLSPALRGFHCPHPSRGVPSSGSQGHHPCPPWGVPVTSRVSPAAPQSQGVSSLWSPGTLSLSPWGLSLLPRGLRCSHPPWDIVPVPPGVPHCLQRFPIPPQSVPVPQGCPILRARGTLSPSLPPGLSLSRQGCPCSHGAPISHPNLILTPLPGVTTTRPAVGAGPEQGGVTHGGGALILWAWPRAELRPAARGSTLGPTAPPNVTSASSLPEVPPVSPPWPQGYCG